VKKIQQLVLISDLKDYFRTSAQEKSKTQKQFFLMNWGFVEE
jgi:hypothetical protein